MANVRQLNKSKFNFCTKSTSNQYQEQTNFGYKKVNLDEKQGFVDGVFHSVANNYDIMNDVMSLGIHRCWKETFVNDIGVLSPQKSSKNQELKNIKVLDMAGGTGDIAFRILEKHKGSRFFLQENQIQVTVSDINQSMLDVCKQRAIEQGYREELINANAEELPFENNSFDVYTIAFGIRNVPRIDLALQEAHRVLKNGGRIMILEFSKVENTILNYFYQFYNFNVVPTMGQIISGDRDSYQYLAESIDKFHTQQELLEKIQNAGFKYSSYKNLNEGIVAIHSGFKLEQ